MVTFEALAQNMRGHEGNEQALRKLRHVISVMRLHEETEGAFLEMRLMTHHGRSITFEALVGGYETQESFRMLSARGSPETMNGNQKISKIIKKIMKISEHQ